MNYFFIHFFVFMYDEQMRINLGINLNNFIIEEGRTHFFPVFWTCAPFKILFPLYELNFWCISDSIPFPQFFFFVIKNKLYFSFGEWTFAMPCMFYFLLLYVSQNFCYESGEISFFFVCSNHKCLNLWFFFIDLKSIESEIERVMYLYLYMYLLYCHVFV